MECETEMKSIVLVRIFGGRACTMLLWSRIPLMAYSIKAIFSLSSDCLPLCGILMTLMATALPAHSPSYTAPNPPTPIFRPYLTPSGSGVGVNSPLLSACPLATRSCSPCRLFSSFSRMPSCAVTPRTDESCKPDTCYDSRHDNGRSIAQHEALDP